MIDNAVQLHDDALRSRRFGFGAKLCIHPRQLASIHQAFAPTAQQLDWAHRVMAALGAGSLGAIVVDGKLVDRPVAARARAILEQPLGGQAARPAALR